MKKYLSTILLCFLLLSSNTLFAVFVTDFPFEFEQPNGEKVQLYITGDEFHRRVHDANGFTVIKDPQTGYLTYAVLKNDNLVSSGYFVGKADPKKLGISPNIDISAEKRRQIRRDFLKATPEKSTLRAAAPTGGTLNNIVVYIRFSDDTEFTQSTGYFADFFNKDVPGESMYRYFKDISHGQLDVLSTFYPTTAGTTVLSYQDTYPRSTFTAVTLADPLSVQASVEHGLLKRCIDAIKSQIPAGLNLDFDSDGYVDNICFIVRGDAGAWASLLWPHQWVLYTQNVQLNGKRVWNYNFQIENHLTANKHSVLTHEMYHTLGAPDVYRYDNTTITPVGSWDVMASNTLPPQSSSAWISHKYAPWSAPEITEITQTGIYTINNVWSPTNNCYKIASPNSTTEFFLIEYRDRNVIWDSKLPGSGLIIYRVNPSLEGNSDGPPDEVYIYRPGGNNTTTNGTLSNAYFSSQVGRTTFSDTSNPPAFLSNNTSGLDGIVISEISASGNATMTFKVTFPGLAAPVTPIADPATSVGRTGFNAIWHNE
ncbi:MAG: hypothetical protein LBI82_07915 [Dysgonamonadaceae bacterium]|jgi:M6 family metalloprotease-like protein|nr:hypothetical protein [Dysgonamonadaceae bacterium]